MLVGIFLVLGIEGGCASGGGAKTVGDRPSKDAGRPTVKKSYVERGKASWYGPQFHGRTTASGEVYDMHGLSAAHKKLPFGTVVRVTNLENGLTVDVPINDRGPFVGNRILDLSFGAAQRLEMVEAGVVRVKIEVVSRSSPTVATGTTSGEYIVQVGAFRSRRHAEDLVSQLRSVDRNLAVYSSTDGWHRVQVRGFDRRERAERLRSSLLEMGIDAVVLERH